jgi:uncharacterized protein (DUF2236 family)
METVQAVPEWRATVDEIWVVLNRTARQMKETDERIEGLKKTVEPEPVSKPGWF